MNLQMLQDISGHTGELKIDVQSQENQIPIKNATIQIAYTGEPDKIIEEVSTRNIGSTENITLNTPPVEYSLSPGNVQPYSEYNLTISAEGFETAVISGVELLEGVLSIQNIQLKPFTNQPDTDRVVIGPHTLYGDYPPKIAEAEVKPVNETGEIVLSRVVVPEYIIVHDGPPSDSSAKNYYVKYKDYIKNVASSEIYATWPLEAIRANILAIMSFTLNRVYTEWYRNKGYDFTITSSTAYDHKWIKDRNIFDTISTVTDELYGNYLSRPNVKQPILTQYCDGRRVTCPNWMSQWGSSELGAQGYDAIDIIRYYYGDNMYINVAEDISGVPSSWPGYNLEIGSSGSKVLQMQEQLNKISTAYPAIPQITADGIYGEATANAVRIFQKTFGLPQTGVVDYPTWYKISEIYVGVSRIAELT